MPVSMRAAAEAILAHVPLAGAEALAAHQVWAGEAKVRVGGAREVAAEEAADVARLGPDAHRSPPHAP